ncbi:MAG TPA: hypothetical protein VE826_02160 [Dongiaceae bacterium]|nr:hypothetical protein [Dongiaceae bacterium]
MAGQLAQIERVAVRGGKDRAPFGGAERAARAPQLLVDHRGGGGGLQHLQAHARDAREPGQTVQHLRARLVQPAFAGRDHEQHGRVVAHQRDVVQELQRGEVAPLGVFEHEREGPARAVEAQRLDGAVERGPSAVGRILAGTAGGRGASREFAERAPQRRVLREHRRLERVELPPEFRDRGVRRRGVVDGATDDQLGLGPASRQLVDEPRLTGSRIAEEQHEARAVSRGLAARGKEVRKVVVPPDQRELGRCGHAAWLHVLAKPPCRAVTKTRGVPRSRTLAQPLFSACATDTVVNAHHTERSTKPVGHRRGRRHDQTAGRDPLGRARRARRQGRAPCEKLQSVA